MSAPATPSVYCSLTSGEGPPTNVPVGAVIVRFGDVLSILRVIVAVAEFPALSVAVPPITSPAPSAATTMGVGQVAIPEASAHSNVTVTSVEFHPFALGGGAPVAVMVGGTRSSPPVTR